MACAWQKLDSLALSSVLADELTVGHAQLGFVVCKAYEDEKEGMLGSPDRGKYAKPTGRVIALGFKGSQCRSPCGALSLGSIGVEQFTKEVLGRKDLNFRFRLRLYSFLNARSCSALPHSLSPRSLFMYFNVPRLFGQ